MSTVETVVLYVVVVVGVLAVDFFAWRAGVRYGTRVERIRARELTSLAAFIFRNLHDRPPGIDMRVRLWSTGRHYTALIDRDDLADGHQDGHAGRAEKGHDA